MSVATDALCFVVDAQLGQICIPMPGGGEICYHSRIGHIPVPADVCTDLIPRIHESFAILSPLMCLIDVGLALVNVAKAIPDSLGPPPDPSALTDSLLELFEKAACLLPLIPQLSICPLLKALLNLIINCLQNIRDQLARIVILKLEVSGGRARSAQLGGVALLDAYLDCAEDNIDLMTAAMSGNTESLQRLLDISVNPLLQSAGLNPIVFNALDLQAGAPDEVLASLDQTIAGLQAIVDGLPC